MVLFTTLALKYSPIDIVGESGPLGPSRTDVSARSTPNLVILATGILLDIALIATLIATALTYQEVKDFWNQHEMGYPVAAVMASLATYACTKIPALITRQHKKYLSGAAIYSDPTRLFSLARNTASFLCFPARNIPGLWV